MKTDWKRFWVLIFIFGAIRSWSASEIAKEDQGLTDIEVRACQNIPGPNGKINPDLQMDLDRDCKSSHAIHDGECPSLCSNQELASKMEERAKKAQVSARKLSEVKIYSGAGISNTPFEVNCLNVVEKRAEAQKNQDDASKKIKNLKAELEKIRKAPPPKKNTKGGSLAQSSSILDGLTESMGEVERAIEISKELGPAEVSFGYYKTILSRIDSQKTNCTNPRAEYQCQMQYRDDLNRRLAIRENNPGALFDKWFKDANAIACYNQVILERDSGCTNYRKSKKEILAHAKDDASLQSCKMPTVAPGDSKPQKNSPGSGPSAKKL